jgi:hypothetical protein
MTRSVTLLAAAAHLSGCSITLPVRGQMDNGTETFAGSATGHMDGAGELQITSAAGLACRGAFVYTTRRTGEGTLNCEDGRSGPFTFVSTGSRGTGSGSLNGRPFTFTFGG